MSNELLFTITLLCTFAGTLLMYLLFGKKGLYAWITFASVVINIEVLKCADMFGLSVTLGNVLYGSTFLATDILSENYGGKESRKAIRLGLMFQVAFIIITQLSMAYEPNENDFISASYSNVFALTPRLCAASLISFFLSNTLDTYLYDVISKHTERIWVRNNCSTLASQLIDTILFTIMAFGGVFETNVLIELTATTYVIKLIVAIADTPFAYIGKMITNKKKKQYEIHERAN